jgi:hypothetical protein
LGSETERETSNEATEVSGAVLVLHPKIGTRAGTYPQVEIVAHALDLITAQHGEGIESVRNKRNGEWENGNEKGVEVYHHSGLVVVEHFTDARQEAGDEVGQSRTQLHCTAVKRGRRTCGHVLGGKLVFAVRRQQARLAWHHRSRTK